jgi:hypothetical protein
VFSRINELLDAQAAEEPALQVVSSSAKVQQH